MITVEFLGIPGSGKSTLCSAVVQRLRSHGLAAASLPEATGRTMRGGVNDRVLDTTFGLLPKALTSRFGESAFVRSPAMADSLSKFCAEHPGLIAAVMNAQERRSSYELRPDLVIRWFFYMAAQYQFATDRSEQTDVLIVDEGFAQRSVLIFGHQFGEQDRDDLARYVNKAPQPDLLIRLDIELDVAKTRLSADGRSPTIRLNGEYGNAADRFLEDALKCVDSTRKLAHSAGWEMFTVSGEADRDETQDLATSAVIKALQG